MKKGLIIILALIMVASLFVFAGCEDGKTLYMYTESGFPPFEYTRGTDVVGVDIEIAKAIAAELGMTLVIKDVEFDSIIAGLTDKNAIGAAGITITEKRAKAVDFSIPYYGDAIQYVIYREGTITINEDLMISGDELKNKKLGVQTGTTGDTVATDESKAEGSFEGATVKQYNNALTAAQDIGGGCDYVIIDRLTALQIVANNKSLNLATSQIADVGPEEYGIIVKKGNKKLLDTINKVIERLLADGTIDEWIDAHSADIE